MRGKESFSPVLLLVHEGPSSSRFGSLGLDDGKGGGLGRDAGPLRVGLDLL